MKNWENYLYGFGGLALAALGVLFMILGAGCIIGSFAAAIMFFKRRASMNSI